MNTISQRAIAPAEMPEHERPISEQFRIVARAWVDAEAAAQLLEETKSSVLAQRMAALGEMAVNKAEMSVKASQDWHDHLKKIVDARREANLKKVNLEFLRIRDKEIERASWAARSEYKMGRSVT